MVIQMFVAVKLPYHHHLLYHFSPWLELLGFEIQNIWQAKSSSSLNYGYSYDIRVMDIKRWVPDRP